MSSGRKGLQNAATVEPEAVRRFRREEEYSELLSRYTPPVVLTKTKETPSTTLRRPHPPQQTLRDEGAEFKAATLRKFAQLHARHPSLSMMTPGYEDVIGLFPEARTELPYARPSPPPSTLRSSSSDSPAPSDTPPSSPRAETRKRSCPVTPPNNDGEWEYYSLPESVLRQPRVRGDEQTERIIECYERSQLLGREEFPMYTSSSDEAAAEELVKIMRAQRCRLAPAQFVFLRPSVERSVRPRFGDDSSPEYLDENTPPYLYGQMQMYKNLPFRPDEKRRNPTSGPRRAYFHSSPSQADGFRESMAYPDPCPPLPLRSIIKPPLDKWLFTRPNGIWTNDEPQASTSASTSTSTPSAGRWIRRLRRARGDLSHR